MWAEGVFETCWGSPGKPLWQPPAVSVYRLNISRHATCTQILNPFESSTDGCLFFFLISLLKSVCVPLCLFFFSLSALLVLKTETMLQVQCDARVVQWLHRVSLEQKSAEIPRWVLLGALTHSGFVSHCIAIRISLKTPNAAEQRLPTCCPVPSSSRTGWFSKMQRIQSTKVQKLQEFIFLTLSH